jgi:hypothetical protein
MAVPCSTAGTFDLVGLPPEASAACPIISNINTMAVDYDPASLITAGTGSYSYTTSTIAPPGAGWFDLIDIGVDVNGVGTYSVSVTKSIYDTSPTGTLLGSITFTQTSAGSTKEPEVNLLDNTYNQLYIVDSYVVSGTDVGIDKVTNTFTQTPGPLPILGAGAAFGFSRKLRRRIKASRTA